VWSSPIRAAAVDRQRHHLQLLADAAELEAATDYQLIAAINAEYLTEDNTEDLAA
jgi:hypothetical protein